MATEHWAYGADGACELLERHIPGIGNSTGAKLITAQGTY